MRYWILGIFMILAQAAVAQVAGVEYQWIEKRDRDGIRIYTSKVPDSPFDAVRGEMEIHGTVAQLVALVRDLDRCPEWADLCEASTSLEVLSTTEEIVHLLNDVPFPVKDRDVVARMQWMIDGDSGRVSMLSTALPESQSESYRASTGKAVRIYDAVTQWHFTPLQEGRVKVENFAHIDPNGPVPAWVTNLLLVNSPFKTMRSMREIIEAGAYSQADLPF